VGPAARHGAARRPLPRAVPRRARHGHRRPGTAGLDILTNGDYHLDEDFAGRSWHHYPLQRWKGLEHEELQYEDSRDGLLDFLPGTLMNEIETTWRWPRVVGKVEHDPKNPLEYAKLWRIAQARARRASP
jgi:5-methyltetrahydropteroyltriglutamate--homocysteine methyltransferase